MIGLRPRATDKVTSRTAGVLEAEFHFFTAAAAATTAASQQKTLVEDLQTVLGNY